MGEHIAMLFHSLEIQHRKEIRDYCTKSTEIEQTGALMFMYIEKTSTDLNKEKGACLIPKIMELQVVNLQADESPI